MTAARGEQEVTVAGILTHAKSLLIRRRGSARVHGVKVAVDPAVMTSANIRRIARKRYEEPEARALDAIIRPDDRVLELGGGVGFMSAVALSRIDPAKGRVVVYEANPLLIPIIRRTHALNGRTAEVNHAVLAPGEVSGSIKFYRRENFSISSLDGDGGDVAEVVDVPLMSFGAVLKDLRPTVLVIDIEGGETTIFNDAPDLSSVRGAVIEFHPAQTGDRAISDVIALLRASGLHLSIRLSSANVLAFVRDA